ncbi:DNA-binding protein [Pontibacter sp. G13]|uniref:DNA-binding protein n=1 Tax=Pontibacter sp. G13 TaxID=3074898 RepID=UPI00288C6182|nr:DNA-binding protein [Pontibacter sp. G13]WNJ17436.1 DNA-binding protein [Pontibacter sp. G13]
MTITFNELRRIKNSFPNGTMHAIADEMGVTVDTVRNYFGGEHWVKGLPVGYHWQQGPDGGIVVLDDTAILEKAKSMMARQATASNSQGPSQANA